MKETLPIFAMIMLFAISFCFAEDALLVSQHKIDSLQTLIDQSSEDKEKVSLLNEYARLNFYNKEFKTGLTATRNAWELSKKIDFEGGQVMYYLTLAAFSGRGQVHNYRLEQARRLVQESDNQLAEYLTELDIPMGYPQGNPEEDLEKLTPLLQYYEDLGNKEIQLTIMNRIGWCYYYLDRRTEVIIILKKMAELSIDLNQLYLEFLFYSRLAAMHRRDGNSLESQNVEKMLVERLSKK